MLDTRLLSIFMNDEIENDNKRKANDILHLPVENEQEDQMQNPEGDSKNEAKRIK